MARKVPQENLIESGNDYQDNGTLKSSSWVTLLSKFGSFYLPCNKINQYKLNSVFSVLRVR